MAYADYLHCIECDCKIVYYTGDEDKKVLCSECLKRKQDIIEQLTKTNIYLSKLLSAQSETFQKYSIPIKSAKLPESVAEVWVDNKLYAVKKEFIGWECPRCGSVNAPQKEKCKCVKIESEEKDTKELLTESK